MAQLLRILLIEDNPGDADLIEDMLAGANVRFELTCAERLSSGIERLKAEDFDVVLLDLGLPDSQGLVTLVTLIQTGPKAPVIVLTGLVDEDAGMQAVKAGAQDFLIKGQIEKNLLARSIKYAVERKMTQAALRESEEQYRALFTNSIDAVLLTKPDGTILAANPEACRLFGSTEEEICRGEREIIIDESDPRFAAALEERTRTGRFKGELILRRRDGSTFPGEISTALFQGVDGSVRSSMIIRDITERKRAEDALKNSEKFIKDILSSVDEAFVVIDRDYRILTANLAYCRQTNRPLAEITGKHCYEIARHLTRPCYEMESNSRCIRTFETGEPADFVHTHTDVTGRKIHSEIKTFAMKDAFGKITSIIEVINDITEKTALEDQLRHSQKLEGIGQLAGGIAHDFNNVLNTVVGYAGMLQMKMDKSDPLKHYVDEIAAAGMRGAALTHQILAFSRKQVLDMQPVNLNEIIKSLEKMLNRLVREDIVINMRLCDKDLVILADASQIDQVLMNLVTNARDAMPGGGTLAIESDVFIMDEEYTELHGYGTPGEYALITVTDSGCGISAEIRSRIFEPFFTTKGVGKGTGLGLAVVHGIVKQHNGFINVYSEAGKGTAFKIFIPLTKHIPKEAEIHNVGRVTGGTETILIAEDDVSIRKLTAVLLSHHGYTVIEAVDGEDAVLKFGNNRNSIQLVILDGIMPNKNGKEAFSEIRKMSPAMRVIFMSGYTEDIFAMEDLHAEGVFFISKPVSPHDFLNKVREALDR